MQCERLAQSATHARSEPCCTWTFSYFSLTLLFPSFNLVSFKNLLLYVYGVHKVLGMWRSEDRFVSCGQTFIWAASSQ